MPTRIEGGGSHFCLNASDKPANQQTCLRVSPAHYRSEGPELGTLCPPTTIETRSSSVDNACITPAGHRDGASKRDFGDRPRQRQRGRLG